MKDPLKEKMLRLNKEGKTLQQIANIVGGSWQRVWRMIHTEKSYIPGKQGFARMSKKSHLKLSSRGGKK